MTRMNFLHVAASARDFEREETVNRDPAGSDLYLGRTHVATIQATGSSDRRLRNAIWTTAVNNAEYDWNCQSWVGDALNSCVAGGLLSGSEVDAAIDQMAVILLEAPDEA